MTAPSFYNPKNAKWSYRADLTRITGEAEKQKLKKSGMDQTKIHLMLIDMQRDFCYQEGSLYVGGQSGTGAIDDQVRMSEFIYNNIERITEITTTLDTHVLKQIFFPWFWLDSASEFVKPHTIIQVDDINAGKFVPRALYSHLVMWRQLSLAHEAGEILL